MGRAAQIVELCAELMEQVVTNGATKATALMELGEEYEGYCFEFTFRKVQPEDFPEDKPAKKKKKRTR